MKAALVAFTAGLMAAAVLGWFMLVALFEVVLLGAPADEGLDRDEEDRA